MQKAKLNFSISTQAKLYLAVVWLLLTTSLAFWWLYFALGLLARIEAEDLAHRQMLLLEGMTLLLLLVAGGTTLIYFIFLEQRQNKTLARFFAAFSHDLKTSLASLRLQAESLKEDVRLPEAAPTIARLLSDTSRLQVQVENSLFLGQASAAKLFIENLESQELLPPLNDSWPQIKFICERNFILKADRRAIETVLNNLAHNSLTHGQATRLQFEAGSSSKADSVEIIVRDNGTGFLGNRAQLGQMHSRQNPSSGSGLGLFIVSQLLRQMGGDLSFVESDSAGQRGFAVRLLLPGRLV